MTDGGNGTNYRDALDDDKSLAMFLRAMASFDRQFCEQMAAGTDFTLRMEVRADKGRLLHVRVNVDRFERPVEVPVFQGRKSKDGRRLGLVS